MNYIYIVELVQYSNNSVELLGNFDTIYNAYDYIEQYSITNDYKIIMNYSDLADDQNRGSIISINNIKKPSKYIYIRSEIKKKLKSKI